MSHRTLGATLALACLGLGLTGCMPHMTVAQMKEQMPKRPAELDRLNDFVGNWKADGEAKFAMLDEPLKVTGTSQIEWAGDRWYIVGRATMTMEHFGDTQALETWTYDMHDKKFRSTWVDSMGMTGTGESTRADKDGTWHMTATSYGPWGKSTMTGSMRFTDPNTMEWSWVECQGLMKIMEMKGTSKRVK